MWIVNLPHVRILAGWNPPSVTMVARGIRITAPGSVRPQHRMATASVLVSADPALSKASAGADKLIPTAAMIPMTTLRVESSSWLPTDASTLFRRCRSHLALCLTQGAGAANDDAAGATLTC
jgi:hypothetical protein